MENAIASLYVEELMAYQYLREIKKLVPLTDTGKVKFISDVEVKQMESEVEANKLKNIVYNEKLVINKIISIFYMQANYTRFPETTGQLQKIAKALFEDCVRKGYQSCGLTILKCIADGAIDFPNHGFPEKAGYLRKGVLDILNSYGERQVLCPNQDFSKRVIEAILEAKNLRYKINFTDSELLNSYNLARIGSHTNKNRISLQQLEGESES